MPLGGGLQAASRAGHFTTGNRNHGTQHMCALGREYFRPGLPVILQNWAIPPSRNLEGGPFTKNSERWMKGALEVERLSLRELCERNLEGGSSFTGDPGGCVKEGSGDGHFPP
jgi:hypothetical protein